MRMRSAIAVLGTLLSCLATRAQAEPPQKPSIVIVQSGLATTGAEQLRAQIAARFQLQVVGLRDVTSDGRRPRALLTLALDEHAQLSVTYWDQRGSVDILSAPAPHDAAELQTAMITLSCAVLQRHLDALRSKVAPADGSVAEDAAMARTVESPIDATSLYAALARFGLIRPRTVALSIEDF